MRHHSFDEIQQWAKRYAELLSFAAIEREFGISRSVIIFHLTKYKGQLNIKFKDEVQNGLFEVGKRLCLPLTGCGKVKDIKDFALRKDSGKHKEQCKECRKKYEASWRIDNADHCSAYTKTYNKNHRKDISAKEKIRLGVDINFRLSKALRNRVNAAIKMGVKTGSSVEDLGCTIDELKSWLEKRFYSNQETGEQMTWANWALDGWHIDHIIPLSLFDLSDHEQFKKACHYTNLQPLWAKENLVKSNKIC